MLRVLVLLLFPNIIVSQVISITVCSDSSCSVNCKTFTSNSGDCFDTLPKCVVTTDSLTFFSDSNCKVPIVGLEKKGVFLTSHCIPLLSDSQKTLGSYKATNISLLIGCIFGVIISFILLYILTYYLIHRSKKTIAPFVIRIPEAPPGIQKPNPHYISNPWFHL